MTSARTSGRGERFEAGREGAGGASRGGAAVWTGAYVALTGLLVVAGTLAALHAVAAWLSGPAGLVVLPVVVGVFAAGPVVARGVLVAVRRRLPANAREAGDAGGSPAALPDRAVDGTGR
jgi:hypothetical protein